VAQVGQGVAFGVTQFLLLPPFYFNNLDDPGMFDWHAKLFELADPRARFILYHIPQITQVPLSVDLAMRLRRTFPDRVMAIKDSAGNWDNTKALLESGEIPVLVGDERLLHKAAAMGAAGSICGMANLYPRRMRNLLDTQTEDVDLSADVDLIVSAPVIAALKQAMVALTGDAGWASLRAPLQPLSGKAKSAIAARFSVGGVT
jgi:4-hydroxy-tetrahydrodipicolinate synthase